MAAHVLERLCYLAYGVMRASRIRTELLARAQDLFGTQMVLLNGGGGLGEAM